MRAVVQRVSRAEVRERESGEVFGRIEHGFCVLLGIGHGDGQSDADWLADKVAGLRIFADPKPTLSTGEPAQSEGGAAGGKNMNRNLADVGGALLVISQFTLYADASKERRPSFTSALAPQAAIPLYEYFIAKLRSLGHRVETGRFGAMMAVELVNDGPVTILLDSIDGRKGPR